MKTKTIKKFASLFIVVILTLSLPLTVGASYDGSETDVFITEDIAEIDSGEMSGTGSVAANTISISYPAFQGGEAKINIMSGAVTLSQRTVHGSGSYSGVCGLAAGTYSLQLVMFAGTTFFVVGTGILIIVQ
jgi:hypothetical protein